MNNVDETYGKSIESLENFVKTLSSNSKKNYQKKSLSNKFKNKPWITKKYSICAARKVRCIKIISRIELKEVNNATKISKNVKRYCVTQKKVTTTIFK